MKNTNKNTPITGLTRDRCYTLAVVCVFLLCFVLLIATTVLWIKYSILTKEKTLLPIKEEFYNALILEKNQLQNRYQLLQVRNTELTLERDCLMERNENLTRTKDELQNLTDNLQSQLNAIETLENQKWKRFDSSLYYIPVLKNWTESQEDCRQKGGHLVIINSQAEQNFINNELGKNRAWIGLSDIQTEDEWKWVDGTSLNQKLKFWRGGGEPNGYRSENCVEVYEPDNQNCWNDNSCFRKEAWICEKNLS